MESAAPHEEGSDLEGAETSEEAWQGRRSSSSSSNSHGAISRNSGSSSTTTSTSITVTTSKSRNDASSHSSGSGHQGSACPFVSRAARGQLSWSDLQGMPRDGVHDSNARTKARSLLLRMGGKGGLAAEGVGPSAGSGWLSEAVDQQVEGDWNLPSPPNETGDYRNGRGSTASRHHLSPVHWGAEDVPSPSFKLVAYRSFSNT